MKNYTEEEIAITNLENQLKVYKELANKRNEMIDFLQISTSAEESMEPDAQMLFQEMKQEEVKILTTIANFPKF